MSRNPIPDPLSATADPVVLVESLELASAPSARLSFAVGRRQVFFLVGPSESGKSALIDLLSFHGLPARGRVEVLGVDTAKVAPAERPSLRRRVGLVFQDQRLAPELDVFENVALAARAAERRPRDFAEAVSELLVWVGLGGRGPDPISRLSEGERRRLCIARALVNRPDLLLVDEPTDGLGDRAAGSVLRLIAEVNAAGTPVVFATRDGDLARTSGGVVHDMAMREFS